MNGLVTIQSELSVKETLDRFTASIEANGLTVFSRIDHGANATRSGLSLRPTELLIFGNPKVGTILMQDKQTSGIDLPMKALAWEDEVGKIWLTYNEPAWLGDRHGLTEKSAETLNKVDEGMKLVSEAATKK